MDENKLLVSAHDAAKMLGISTRTLWSRTDEGAIPHVRIGHRVLYSVKGLQNWIAEQERAK